MEIYTSYFMILDLFRFEKIHCIRFMILRSNLLWKLLMTCIRMIMDFILSEHLKSRNLEGFSLRRYRNDNLSRYAYLAINSA